MKRLLLPLMLFFLLVLEGVALKLLPTSLALGALLIIPHWIFILLLFIAVFYDKVNTYHAVLYAAVFGLLIDIVYTEVLGVYMFSYAIVIYIIHELKKMFHTNFYVTILLGIVGVSLADISINLIYSVIGIVDMPWGAYLIYRLLPTVLANTLFLLVVYPLMRKRLERWQDEQLS